MASDLSGWRERPLKLSQEYRVDRHDSRLDMEVPIGCTLETDLEFMFHRRIAGESCRSQKLVDSMGYIQH